MFYYFFSADLEQYPLILYGTYDILCTYHSSTLQFAVVCTLHILLFLGAIKVSTIHLYFIKLTGWIAIRQKRRKEG